VEPTVESDERPWGSCVVLSDAHALRIRCRAAPPEGGRGLARVGREERSWRYGAARSTDRKACPTWWCFRRGTPYGIRTRVATLRQCAALDRPDLGSDLRRLMWRTLFGVDRCQSEFGRRSGTDVARQPTRGAVTEVPVRPEVMGFGISPANQRRRSQCWAHASRVHSDPYARQGRTAAFGGGTLAGRAAETVRSGSVVSIVVGT
jgi:hypothetical protein